MSLTNQGASRKWLAERGLLDGRTMMTPSTPDVNAVTASNGPSSTPPTASKSAKSRTDRR